MATSHYDPKHVVSRYTYLHRTFFLQANWPNDITKPPTTISTIFNYLHNDVSNNRKGLIERVSDETEKLVVNLYYSYLE